MLKPNEGMMVLEQPRSLRAIVVAGGLDASPPWRLPPTGELAYDSAQQRRLVVTGLAESRPQYVNVVTVAGGRKDLLCLPVAHESGIVSRLLAGVCPCLRFVELLVIRSVGDDLCPLCPLALICDNYGAIVMKRTERLL